jgi:magnesium-transporting ATPase (P-type)
VIKRADIDVAMGVNGREGGKEVEEMALAGDIFSSIAQAVKEERRIFDHMATSIIRNVLRVKTQSEGRC